MRCRQIFNCHLGSAPIGTESKHQSQISRGLPRHGSTHSHNFTMFQGRHLRLTHSEIWDNEVFEYTRQDDKKKNMACVKSFKGLWHRIMKWLSK